MDTELRTLIEVKRIAEAALLDPRLAQSVKGTCGDALTQIQELIGNASASAELLGNDFISECPALSEGCYIMPPELEEFDTKLKANIEAGDTFSNFTYTGLCLYGGAGNGKSEYTHHLKGYFGDHVNFYQISAGSIRGADNPALEVKKIYEQIRVICEKEGKKAVIFIDEFDQFFSTKTAESSSEQSKTHSHSKSSTTTDKKHSSIIADTIGVSILNELKTQLSGSNNGSNVFTIATTNKKKKEIPHELIRKGRLNPIIVNNPIDVQVIEAQIGPELECLRTTIKCTQYEYLYKYAQEVVEIFIAIENRNDTPSKSKISTLEKVLIDLKRVDTKQTRYKLPPHNSFEYNNKFEKKFLENQRKYLTRFFEALGLNDTEELIGKFEIVKGLDESFRNKSNFPEQKLLQELTRADIAGVYKENRKDLNEENIGNLVANLMLPQLTK